MIIGIVHVALFLPESSNLKEKRMIMRSLKDRLRKNFNISLAEVDGHDKWQRATLACVMVGLDRSSTNSQLSHLVNFLEAEHAIQISDVAMEFM